MGAVHPRIALAAVCAAILAGGVAGCGGSPSSLTPFAPSLGSCSQAKAPTYAGASTTLGLDAQNATAPTWSSDAGRLSVVVGDTAYGIGATSGSECIVAVDVATGRPNWYAAAPAGHPELFGVTADASTVLAAAVAEPKVTRTVEVSSTVDELVAYSARTGTANWAVTIPDIDQSMTARLTGGVVVVSEADGSVIGLSESDGHLLWADPAPAKCANAAQEFMQPTAAVIGLSAPLSGGVAPAVIAFGCPEASGSLAEVDPSNGSVLWTWKVPEGWELDEQTAAVVNTGAPEGYLVAAPISLIPKSNAPRVIAVAPGPAVDTKIAGYGPAPEYDVVVLDAAAGHPLWDLEGVDAQALSAVGGAGSLCILTDAGGDCRSASDGASRWSVDWPGSNASWNSPALDCIDLGVSSQPCAVSSDGRLYLALATDSAPAYLLEPGPATPAGAFVIAALNMATGATLSTLTLPSFDNTGSDQGVSLSLPPAVLLVADGQVLVSPQFEATEVVEALAAPRGTA